MPPAGLTAALAHNNDPFSDDSWQATVAQQRLTCPSRQLSGHATFGRTSWLRSSVPSDNDKLPLSVRAGDDDHSAL